MLHEFVTHHHATITARTTEKLRVRNWSVAASELESGVPVFLTQLAETLRSGETGVPFPPDAIGATAARHGRELLDLGFDVSQLVHVYGDVCQAITELALEHDAPIAIGEFHTLNRCLDTAIAEAATEHARVSARRTETDEIERLGHEAHGLRQSLAMKVAAIRGLVADRRRLRQLARRLLGAEDRERQRMAHELDENIVQWLVTLRMTLRLARDSDVTMGPSTRQIITDALSLLDTCCSDICTMSRELHPLLIAPFGLEPAIDAYVRSFARRTGIEVSVDVPNGVGRSRAAHELALFRVMQEALRNVHQSGRKKAGVRVFRDARAIVLEVTDDAGDMPMDQRSPQPSTSGAEVAGMGERVKALGGRLTVWHVDSRTTVRAAIPSRVGEEHSTAPAF
jgi:signal transduction histidine kinase